MDSVGFVKRFLSHYASEFYDPAKAHEYYLKTRELKGRQSTADLKTDSKKEAWAYAKKKLSEAKKGDLTDAAEVRKAVVEHAQEVASERRKQITEQLTALFATLTENRKTMAETIEREKSVALQQLADQQRAQEQEIRDKAQKKLDALPPLPKGASEKERNKRAEKVAEIRGNSFVELQSLKTSIKAQRQAVLNDSQDKRSALSAFVDSAKQQKRESASVDREAVSGELKATVEKARADYESLKENLKAEYEQKTQTEYDAIKNRV